MIEIIAILVVIGIVGVTVVGRQISYNTELHSQTRNVKTHIRYAQSLCMNSDRAWGICCDGSNYWLFKNGSTGDQVMLPGEDSVQVDLSDKGINMGAFTISFTEKGIPCTDAGATAAQSGNRTISISAGGDSESVLITQNTGYIP
jgi:Tfp pilus assembly protein FimT